MQDQRGVEHEIKLPVPSVPALRRRLTVAGWRCCQPSQREDNRLFDTADGSFTSTQRLLRLRRYGERQLLTYKGPPRFSDGVKSRREIEVELSDLEAMTVILAALGLRASLRYQKDREIWQRGELLACLDHTPMGDFVELEGVGELLPGAALELGLDPRQGIRASYPELWARRRAAHPAGELPLDMVFDDG